MDKRKSSRITPVKLAAAVAAVPDAERLSGLPERYRFQAVLSNTGCKQVYRAKDDIVGRDVAIAAFGIADRQISEKEVQAHLLLGKHPNIVTIHETMEGDGQAFIVSEFCQGGDLTGYLDRCPDRRPSFERTIEIASQVCRALEHAHGRGVVHGDLKPDNIFLDEAGVAVLGDFGLASIYRWPEADPGRQGMAGTPAYMAPETIGDSSFRPHSDLYALGCVLYEMTTGAPPFGDAEAAGTAEIVRRHQLVVPEAPALRAPGTPIALNDLILRLLAKDPDARPATVRDVRAALEGILLNRLPFLNAAAATEHGRNASAKEHAGGLPDRCAHLLELPFVGRDAELEALLGALGSAESGRPRVCVVRGEPGIGKTRLLREFRRNAEIRGALVLQSEGSNDAPIPYRLVVDALLPIAGSLSELSRDDATLVRRLLQIDNDNPARESRSDGERERMFLAASRALLATSTRR